jgi:hypothetical protein
LWKCAADANAAVAGSYGDCSGCGRGTDDRTDCRSYGDLDPDADANLAANVHADAIADAIADEHADTHADPDLDADPNSRTEHSARDGPASPDQRGL